jgi:hypothetical protein
VPLQDFWTDLYECALMLCQAKDMRNCADYGNGRAAVVTLAQPGCMLKEEDGSVSGQMTTVPLPNAEAVIVYGVSTAPSNTSPPPPTVIANTPIRSLTSNAPTTPPLSPLLFSQPRPPRLQRGHPRNKQSACGASWKVSCSG